MDFILCYILIETSEIVVVIKYKQMYISLSFATRDGKLDFGKELLFWRSGKMYVYSKR